MSTLVNLVLAVVLNLFSHGNIQHTNAVVSTLESSRTAKCNVYQLEDLRSSYVITKQEFIQYSFGIN